MTPLDLRAIIPSISEPRAAQIAAPLTDAMAEFAINTPRRVAGFLSQLAHESGSFRYSREVWGPTPAQARYEGRADLGNTITGDGIKFLGRAWIQITGRTNYRSCGQALGLPLLEQPQLLEQPGPASRASGWFWSVNGLNRYADADQFFALTKAINGGYNGGDDRLKYWLTARAALGL